MNLISNVLFVEKYSLCKNNYLKRKFVSKPSFNLSIGLSFW